eukprot:SAG31_NODE_1971_length_6758_cov_3.905205_5_plen_125_part_00
MECAFAETIQPSINPSQVTIALMEGTHYLAEPVLLTPKDSGLTISSFEGGDTTVSGARPIKGLKWEKYKVEQGSTEWIVQPGINDVYAATTGAGSVPLYSIFLCPALDTGKYYHWTSAGHRKTL